MKDWRDRKMVELTAQEELARPKLCLPLDVPTLVKAAELVEGLSDFVGLFKTNSLWTRFGQRAIDLVHNNDSELFLDPKFYDIPQTMFNHAYAATQLEVYTFNVHASAGYDGMKQAIAGREQAIKDSGGELRRPKVTAVTVLTSFTERQFADTYRIGIPLDVEADFRNMSDDEFIAFRDAHGIPEVIEAQVRHFAMAAHQAGLDGIVSSAADLGSGIRGDLPDDFIYKVAGVKGPQTDAGSDQAANRVFTPYNALEAGATILVMGRAITDPRTQEEKAAKAPITMDMQRKAAHQVLQDMARYEAA